MKTFLLHTLYIVLLSSLAYVVYAQNSTVVQQQQLIREMMKNPYCLVPEVK